MGRAARNAKRKDAFAASEPARKAAVAVLSVMAGMKTPLEASSAIGVSVNRYYQIETRALSAMVKALEPLPRGRRRRPEAEIERLLREKARVEREASRYQALWRAGQRALGLASPPTKSADSKPSAASGKRPRRPRMRAKAVIAALTASPPTTSEATPGAAGPGGTS
jgi:hypothetical protein